MRVAAIFEIVLERPSDIFCGGPQLGIEIGDLGIELLDPRVAGKQAAGLERELRLRRHQLFGDTADEVVVGDIRHFRDSTLPEHVADERRLCLAVRLRGAGARKVAAEVGELLAGDRHIVGAGKQSRYGAVTLYLVGRVRDFDFQIADLLGKRGCDLARDLALRVGLHLEVEAGDFIRGAGCESRVARIELNDQNSRFLR